MPNPELMHIEDDRVERFWRACRAHGLRRNGLSLSEVAARVGVSVRTVQRDLRELVETTTRDDLLGVERELEETGWARLPASAFTR
jgi:predicted DNA-binding transcriptional regulator YafY